MKKMIDNNSLQFIKENSNAPSKWLAAKTGYSDVTIRKYLRVLGLYKPKKISEKMKKIILENKDISGKELAIKLGISEASVSNIRSFRKNKRRI